MKNGERVIISRQYVPALKKAVLRLASRNFLLRML